jgi:tetratricopeptide (TPR) repeat protein
MIGGFRQANAPGLYLAIMRLLRALSAAALSVAFAASVEAQVIRVAGTIKDDAGHPIRGAIVTAENPDQAPSRLTTTSNDKGEFGFIGIRRGLWMFSIDAPGHEAVRFRRQVAAGRQEPIQVTLSKTATPTALPLDGTNAGDILQRIDRAESLSSSGDVDGAIAAWREVLAKVPRLTSAHLQIGALYERKPDVERALAAYRQLLAIEPANAKALAAIERLAKRL